MLVLKGLVLGYNLKNDRMILVYFQGKPFNITVIRVYAPTGNAEEAEGERFCHASVRSSILCLVTTKIWSDRH